jgi:ribokinase
MRTITVIGSVNIDLVSIGDRLPRVGETVLGREFRIVPGGKGANQAIAAAKLGAHVRFVGCVGNDDYGCIARENLKQYGIDIRRLRTVPAHTGVALIMLDRHGRNLISVAPGANTHVKVTGRHDIVLTQLETPYARPNARLVILNPAPAKKVALRGVDVLIPNQIEAEQLSGERDPRKAARVLQRLGAQRVIITLGERGVFDGEFRPAFKIVPCDTVGAGDTFVGAFAAALAENHPDPVAFAQAAAALKCTRPGAQNVPSRKQVERLLRRPKL